jgi:enoyl-CoA hydratase/carnithine racemase
VPEARFQLPFVNIGIVPEFASTLLLPRLLGNVQAGELLLLGEAFTAPKALELGLLNALVPAADLMTHVNSRAAVIAAKPPTAMRQSKALMRASAAEISAHVAKENKILAERLTQAEFKEAAAAFFEKRAPDFSKF